MTAVAAFAFAAERAQAAAPPGWAPDVRAAERWAQQREGVISFAVRTEDRAWGLGADRQVRSASLVKAMLLAVYLRRPDVRGRPLEATERALLGPMVRRSSNRAATRVRDIVGNAALARFATRIGMARFATAPSWGASLVTPGDQARLFLGIDRALPPRHRAYGLRLLETIVPRQRWGIARAAPAGWRLYFKGGWTDGPGSAKHQVALLRRGRLRVAIAVLTSANPTDVYGKRTLEGIALRLLRGLPGARGRAAV